MEKDLDITVILRKTLFIPEKYTKPTKQDDRVVALVHRSWLSALLQKGHPDIFKYHEKLSEYEVGLFLKLGEPFEPSWQHLSVRVVKLFPDEKVYPLPRPRQINGASLSSQHLSYSQLCHYIAHTNYKNSWKESFKKYSNFSVAKESQNVPLLSKSSVLLEVVKRVYCCPVINLSTREMHAVPKDGMDTHPNCLPAVCALFTSEHLILLQNHVPHSLSDCITFSPAVLFSARSWSLFVIFQLLQALRDCHDRGVVLGDISLHDLLISPSLWVNILPKLQNNLISPDLDEAKSLELDTIEDAKVREIILKSDREKAVGRLVDLWVRGQVSNYDYLIALNTLAGRQFGHPSHHHVLPWVIDFSSPTGGWRDLTKSKFRLNKGDRQLDLTFETAGSQQNCDSSPLQIPHHVSDFLSEITYFVYLARRTPKYLLCKYVRSNWVPAEYPSSIQRMQEWTPDECIPEFFSNPTTFKSIHEDLPDLDLPSWASSPELFIEKHRQALESIHVSERLHHWIDLTFGHKLSGSAAVKSKNVCLYLVDNHTSLSDCGVVQLFTQPHPHRITPNPYLEKVAPKIAAPANARRLESNTLPCILSPAVQTPEKIEDEKSQEEHLADELATLGVSKHLSKSRTSLQTEDLVIHLPKDFNPVTALQDVESLFHFTTEVLHEKANESLNQQPSSSPYKKAIASSRVKEMQILGCLIVEIYLSIKLRASDTTHSDLETRLSKCLKVVEKEWKDIPFAVKKIISVLLELDDSGRKKPESKSTDWFQSIAPNGLPPPSAHQLLQPLLSGIVPFPEYFEQLYILLAEINKLENSPEETSELEVNLFRKALPCLVPKMDADGLNLLIPHVVRLLKSESATNAAWRLFDPLAKALGPKEAANKLLEPIADLIDSGGANRAKLYHRSFLLKLMVRFGLKVFINNFIKSLVEAVGGYKDQHCKSPTLEYERRKSENLISVDNFAFGDGDPGILSPLDEDSSADSDKLQTQQENLPDKKDEGTDTENEPEVFMFDSNENEDDSAANTVTSPAVALDLMAQLEIDMDQDTENSVLLSESEAPKVASPTFEQEDVIAVASVQTEWRPPRKPVPGSEDPVSEESAESLLWLAHRIGPVLTARHLSRNLLRMLSLCYLGESSLTQVKQQDSCCQTIPGMKIVGDENSTKVMSCLIEIAAIYGEQLVVLQYFGHMTELIALCRRKLTANLEAGLIGCLSLLCNIIPYLSDTTLMNQISDILKNIVHPSVRLVATTRAPFPSGSAARLALAYKLLEALYVISMRIGMDMTKLHLSVTLQRYFLAFDKAYDRTEAEMISSGFLEVKREGSEVVLRGSPLQISHVMVYESIDSFSPPAPIQEAANEIRTKALHEIKSVFNEKLAHCIYVPFYRLLGENLMEKVIKNEALIRDLCYQYEKQSPRLSQCQGAGSFVYLSDLLPSEDNLAGTSSSFGTNVSVIGNRIELQRPDIPSTLPSPSFKNLDEVSNIINKRMENTSRHLRGNWLAYWGHEIGRPDKDTKFNFKQIKLQQFTGHTHSVRALSVLDNENSFISGSRDKSVKLWSLRSQGDGSTASTCRWSYNQHRKSVLAIAYVEPMGLVASCDSVVHLWDPFMGSNVAVLDGASRTANAPVNVLHSMPAPSCLVLAATTDSTIKVIDVRTGEYVIEMKVANAASGLIRCICTGMSGNWVAVGQASGFLSLLDIRTGMIISSWKGHEGEVLQLAASPGSTIVSSSLDQTVAAWNSDNGSLRCLMKGPTEPVHCLSSYNNELISGTTANRIGVHTVVGHQAIYSSTRLRSDTFKGVLTAMAVLPLNRLLLLGSDAGHISLLC